MCGCCNAGRLRLISAWLWHQHGAAALHTAAHARQAHQGPDNLRAECAGTAGEDRGVCARRGCRHRPSLSCVLAARRLQGCWIHSAGMRAVDMGFAPGAAACSWQHTCLQDVGGQEFLWNITAVVCLTTHLNNHVLFSCLVRLAVCACLKCPTLALSLRMRAVLLMACWLNLLLTLLRFSGAGAC